MSDNNEKNTPKKSRKKLYTCGAVILISFLFLVGWLATAALESIRPGERGVVISALEYRGFRDEPLEPGLHVIWPFLESVTVYSVAPQIYDTYSELCDVQSQPGMLIIAKTADGIEVFIDVSIVYAIDPDGVFDVHISWQDRLQGDLVCPAVRMTVQDTVNQYSLLQLKSNTITDIELSVVEQLKKLLEENGVNLIEFNIKQIRTEGE